MRLNVLKIFRVGSTLTAVLRVLLSPYLLPSIITPTLSKGINPNSKLIIIPSLLCYKYPTTVVKYYV